MGARRRAACGALLGAVVAVLAFVAHERGVTSRWEYLISDLHFRVRPSDRGPGDVVVVGITRDCMEDEELGPLPWPRRNYARAVRQLRALGASVICFDVFFSLASPKASDGVDDDAELAKAIREAGNVILPVFDKFRGTRARVVDFQESLPLIEDGAAAKGHINVLPDADGIVRRCPLKISSLGRSYLQLGVVAANVHLKRTGGRPAPAVPTESDRGLRIPWRPPQVWRAGENLFAFADVYHGRVPRNAIEGKIVFVGQTAPGLPNADIIGSPFGPRFGIFCQADIAQGVLSNTFVRSWSEATHLAVLLAIGIGLGTLMFTLRLGPIVAGALGAVTLEVAAGVAVFRLWGVLVELVPSFSTVFVLLCVSLAYGLANRAKEARRWSEAMEVLRRTGVDATPGQLGGESYACEDPLALAGTLAAILRVPEAAPRDVVGVLSSALGAQAAFIRFQGRGAQTQWVSTVADAPESAALWQLAYTLADEQRHRGPSFVVPRLARDRALARFAPLASSALVLRLGVHDNEVGTVVLCGKTPTPLSPTRHFGVDDLRVALALAPQAALLLDHARLHHTLYTALKGACATLASAMSARDEYTSGHSGRVALYAVFLARQIGLAEWCVEAVELGALLHDIGKIAMDEVILRGSSTLTEEERELVRRHPGTGADIFRHLDEMAALLPAIRHHHERYDGKGYPDGLAGAQIPLLARIVGIADSFDAMTFRRPYRPRALSFEEACAELRKNAGTQFDPHLVEVFVTRATPELVRQARETMQLRVEPASSFAEQALQVAEVAEVGGST